MAISNNLILYGPPGTGKTYNTVNYAVAIIECRTYEDVRDSDYGENLKKFDEYTKLGRIGFVTFHQSLGYDDFIEGIKPVPGEDGESLLYLPTPGAFYEFCRKSQFPMSRFGVPPEGWDLVSDAPRVWLSSTGRPVDCEAGDLVMEPNEDWSIASVSVATEDSLRELKRLEPGFPAILLRISQRERDTMPSRLQFVTPAEVLAMCQHEEGGHDEGNCVYVIDEINRGNISRIFGELITLLESSRRKGLPECIEVSLAQLKVKFSIPQKVFVLGTMNTADKSLAALDTALRRRFEFVEMMPDANALRGRVVSDVDLSRLLTTMNKRIEMLYDREHMMGQAYFISVRTMPQLAQCFMKKVIPLLQEYFFDDYEKIGWVMGKASDPRDCVFVRVRERSRFQMMFDLPDVLDIVEDEKVFMDPENYIQIYRGEED
ncbi:MAG: AAA family ATPase [Thermoplasmata archaeon]|nr:AAA family ATPase [Thermoplasmata archaeon]